MRTAVHDERDSTAAFELAAGCVALVVAGFVAAAWRPSVPVDRALIMATAAGLLAALLREWRSCIAVVVIAALVYVGFLAHRAGQLSGDPTPWRYTLLIGVAALIGRGLRWSWGRRLSRGLRRIPVTRSDDTRPPVIDTRPVDQPDDRRQLNRADIDAFLTPTGR